MVDCYTANNHTKRPDPDPQNEKNVIIEYLVVMP